MPLSSRRLASSRPSLCGIETSSGCDMCPYVPNGSMSDYLGALWVPPLRNQRFARLTAGAEWTRTFSSAVDWQQFVVSSESGAIYQRTVIRTVAGLGEPIELSDGVRGAATYPPDQAASHQGRAVGGARRIAEAKVRIRPPPAASQLFGCRSGGTLRICSGSITEATPS